MLYEVITIGVGCMLWAVSYRWLMGRPQMPQIIADEAVSSLWVSYNFV